MYMDKRTQLIGDISTRSWDAICVVLAQDHKTSHLVLSWQDFDVLQSMMAAIEPLLIFY